MKDNEIINALECCKKDDCDNCPNDFGNCYANLSGYALNLITRQQAEIEELKIENKSLRSAANCYKLYYNEARTEAIKEFAYRLKQKSEYYENGQGWEGRIYYEDDIDKLLKEMVGDTE